jgi:glycosyltransferase involved in cell wall biosynthesis
MIRLKILASHPVQYHVPFFRALIDSGIALDVGYYHQGTAGRRARDREFGIDIEWDVDLLSGYPHRFFCNRPTQFTIAEQLRLAPALMAWAVRDHTTPLLLMGWFAEFVWLTWLLRAVAHAPVLVMSETTPLSFAMTSKPQWRVGLLRRLLRRTDACLYIGSRNQQFYLSMGVLPGRLFHVPYSIDNRFFSERVAAMRAIRDDLCQLYQISPALPTFLFCGKLIEKKRPLQLLDAYIAANLHEQAQLIYVGEGNLRRQLEERIRNDHLQHVKLLGFLNQSQMPLAYVLGEVLCLLSEPTETWGLVVNEALVCGRPVIVAESVGCAPDLVSERNGWVVPLDDHAALVRTMKLALAHRADWQAMGAAGQYRVQTNTFGAMANGAFAALQAVVAEQA